MPTGEQVANRAMDVAKTGKDVGVGLCLKFARTCAGAAADAPSAIVAWKKARYRHVGGVPPRGSFVFWEGGKEGHGHVAVSDGKGYVWSTDIRELGKVSRVTISYLGARWTNIKYLGWAEDVNGVRVTGLAPVPMPTITLRNIRVGARNDDVKRVQLALRRKGYGKLNPSGATGYFGAETRAMARAFQATWDQVHADGLIGTDTLARLGFAAR